MDLRRAGTQADRDHQASTKSTTTGAWSEGFCPLRASRSLNAPEARWARSSLTSTRSMRMPLSLVEIAGAIVPPCEDSRLVEAGEHVGEPPCFDLAQSGSLGLTHVRLADEMRGIPDVPVLRCHVEIAADSYRISGLAALVEHGAQPGQPLQLDLVEFVVKASAVGHIDRVHPHPSTRGRNDAASVFVLRAVEASRRIPHTQAADDRHTVPAPITVVHRLVAQLGESLEGNLSSANFVSWTHSTSGSLAAIHSVTRGSRAPSELTFQVARRTSSPHFRR